MDPGLHSNRVEGPVVPFQINDCRQEVEDSLLLVVKSK